METIIVKVDTKNNATNLSSLLHLIKGVENVELLPESENNDLMYDLEQSLKEVKLMQEGKLRGKSLKELLNGK